MRMLNCCAVLDRPVDRLDDVARVPAPSRVEHLQVDEVRARRHAAVAGRDRRVVGRRAAMMPATCVPWPNASTAAPLARREVHVGDDAAAERRAGARCPSRSRAMPMPAAVVARQPLEAAPHLVGADRLRRSTAIVPAHDDVTRQVRHRFVRGSAASVPGVTSRTRRRPASASARRRGARPARRSRRGCRTRSRRPRPVAPVDRCRSRSADRRARWPSPPNATARGEHQQRKGRERRLATRALHQDG